MRALPCGPTSLQISLSSSVFEGVRLKWRLAILEATELMSHALGNPFGL